MVGTPGYVLDKFCLCKVPFEAKSSDEDPDLGEDSDLDEDAAP